MIGAAKTGDEGASRSRRVAVARLRAGAPRHLATAAMLVLVALGLRALLWPPSPAAPSPAPVIAADPSRDLALRFARAYLTFDARYPGSRERALAPFVPEGLDPGAGLVAATGSQRVRWAQIASDQRALAGGRVLTVAAGLAGHPDPVYLAVTVRADPRRGVAIGGYPAFVGPPIVDRRSPAVDLTALADPAIEAVAVRALRNYLAGSVANLRADLIPDAVVSLPAAPLAVREVEALGWLAGPSSGALLATVLAADRRGVAYTLSYELGIERRERPYVSFVQVIPTDK